MIKQIIIAIIAAIAISIALSSIFNFLGTPLYIYGNWIFWIDAMVIFYILLPSKQSSIFSG
jgi:hypothetical protein|tara:strand:- start:1243 stop:1425 length:183 start_codon:yes stop_codon:yes gene_type:complete